MAKATKPGNIAVAGIKETVTSEPTLKQDGTTASQAKKEEAAAALEAAKQTQAQNSQAQLPTEPEPVLDPEPEPEDWGFGPPPQPATRAVVSAETIVKESGAKETNPKSAELIVAPKDVDAMIRDLSRVLSDAINLMLFGDSYPELEKLLR